MTKRKTKFKKLEGEEKYTSTEMPVSQIISRKNEEDTKQNRQNKIIEQSIQYLNEIKHLETESFYLVHVNWFCVYPLRDQYDELNKVNIFYPAEIAISEFNLKDGLIRRFHKFVTVDIPRGYASESKDRFEKVHRIPAGNELGETDLSLVYAEIKSFLTHNTPNGSIPPLYTLKDNLTTNMSTEAVCSVFKTLFFHARTGVSFTEAALLADEWESEFKIYPLEKLFFEIGKIYVPNLMIDDTVPGIIMDRDPYMYETGVACKYHEEADFIHNCSLSVVSRMTMVLRDACVKEMFQKDKKVIPPVNRNVAPKQKSISAPEQVQFIQQQDHNKMYPSMKQTNQNGSSSQNQSSAASSANQNKGAAEAQSSNGANNIGVGNAWARPLVYQTDRTGNANASGDSAAANFPPLGGLRISNDHQNGGNKNNNNKQQQQQRKKK